VCGRGSAFNPPGTTRLYCHLASQNTLTTVRLFGLSPLVDISVMDKLWSWIDFGDEIVKFNKGPGWWQGEILTAREPAKNLKDPDQGRSKSAFFSSKAHELPYDSCDLARQNRMRRTRIDVGGTRALCRIAKTDHRRRAWVFVERIINYRMVRIIHAKNSVQSLDM